MKIIVICPVLVLLLICSAAQGADLKDGFMQTRWGTAAADLAQFSKVRQNDEVAYYVNPSQLFEFDGNKIEDVIYGFYRNQFFAVYVKVDKIELFGRMKDYMTTKYGNPSQKVSMKTGLTVYKWKYEKVKMKLKASKKDGQMKLAIYYTPLSNKINEDQQEIFVDQSVKWFPVDRKRPPENLPSIPLLRF